MVCVPSNCCRRTKRKPSRNHPALWPRPAGCCRSTTAAARHDFIKGLILGSLSRRHEYRSRDKDGLMASGSGAITFVDCRKEQAMKTIESKELKRAVLA